MNEALITEYITSTFDGVHVVDMWGDTFFFYNPNREQPDEIYFATLKSKDDEYDTFSNLNRSSVFRLNIGVGRETYRSLFGAPPPRSSTENDMSTGDDAGDDASNIYDFTALDRLMPHPVYGRQYWLCVLNPSEATFQQVKPLLAEAYERAVDRYTKQAARR